MQIFISYKAEDKKLVGELKDKLEEFKFNVFVSHDSLEGLGDWRQDLIDEIKESDIFLAFITEKYKKSDYTSQEIGIALGLNIPIVPLKAGGTPYGLIYNIQSIPFKSIEDKLIIYIFQCFINRYSNYTVCLNKLIQHSIKCLAESNSFSEAEKYASILIKNKKFTEEQLKEIVEIFLDEKNVSSSGQVQGAGVHVLFEELIKQYPKMYRIDEIKKHLADNNEYQEKHKIRFRQEL